jgi:hypothetical protein
LRFLRLYVYEVLRYLYIRSAVAERRYRYSSWHSPGHVYSALAPIDPRLETMSGEQVTPVDDIANNDQLLEEKAAQLVREYLGFQQYIHS